MRLSNKVSIITGGASNLGAATARRFAQEGATVIIADVIDVEGKTMVEEIIKQGRTASFEHHDVTNEDSWRKLVHGTVKQFGKLDILVNNAGISGTLFADQFDTEGWNRLQAVNAAGPFFGIKYAVPAMIENGGGSIVNLSSISGMVGFRNLHHGYCASKGSVRALTKSASIQYGPDNIRVNSVHPGLMPPMRTKAETTPLTPERRAKLMEGVPLGRFGTADEIANAVLFLASDEAAYITGAELCVDGGYLAQ